MTKQRRPLNAKEVAVLLGKSPRQIIRDAEAGLIRGEKMPGRTGPWLFSAAYIEALAADATPVTSGAA